MAGPRIALVLGGGVALGAFAAGAAAAVAEAGIVPGWLLGASAGAVAAAILAGGPPDEAPAAAAARLDAFWASLAQDPLPPAPLLGAPPPGSLWRRAVGNAGISQAMLLGRPGLYRPVLPGTLPSLYELTPLRARLPALVDFARLHAPGAPRLTVNATDLLSGEPVVFDTGRGDRIGPDEIVASSSLPPLFAPARIGERLLADGALTANTPLAAPLAEPGAAEALVLAVELFHPEGSAPESVTTAAARAGDIVFGHQTRAALDAERRAHALRAALRRATAPGAPLPPETEGPETATVLLVGLRAPPDEAGALKPFDFTRSTLADRHARGLAAMREALALPRAAPGEFRVHVVTG